MVNKDNIPRPYVTSSCDKRKLQITRKPIADAEITPPTTVLKTRLLGDS
jgi:hypothetical protein